MNELLYIGIAQALFTTLFILFKNPKLLSEKILVIWIIFLAMPLLSRALSPAVLNIPLPIISNNFLYSLCFGPFLWFYVQSLTGKMDRFRLTHLYHLSPFLIITLLQLITKESSVFPEMPKAPPLGGRLPIAQFNIASLICYSAMTIWRLHQHRLQVLDNFSSLSTQITLKWLTWLTFGFVIAYLLPLLGKDFALPKILQSHAVAFVSFIYLLSFFGLKQTQIFVNNHPLEDENSPQQQAPNAEIAITETEIKHPEQVIVEPKDKYERSALTPQKAQQYLTQLEQFSATEKPYLDTELTVDGLAKKLQVPRHHLTQVLSEQLNKNFYSYINEYRVQAVKEYLSNPQCEQMTLLDIAYESGFNSKSTFNLVFKKITGITPSQYKKSLKKPN